MLGEGFPVASQFNVKLDPSNSYYLTLKIDEIREIRSRNVEFHSLRFTWEKSLLLWFNKLKNVLCSS